MGSDQDDRSHIPWDNPTLSASAEQHLSLWEVTYIVQPEDVVMLLPWVEKK